MCSTACMCEDQDNFVETILWGSMFIKVKHLPLQSHLTLQQAYPIFFLFVAFPSIQQESGNETRMGVHSILILPAIQKHSASCLPEYSGTRFCSSMELAGTNKHTEQVFHRRMEKAVPPSSLTPTAHTVLASRSNWRAEQPQSTCLQKDLGFLWRCPWSQHPGGPGIGSRDQVRLRWIEN